MTENELMAEFVKEINLPYLEDDDITVRRLELRANCSNSKASRLLEQKVKDGILTKVTKRDATGHIVTAYISS
jgi:Fic family protein